MSYVHLNNDQWQILLTVPVRLVHRQSREFPARGSRRGDQRFRRVPVRTWSEFHGHSAKLKNGKYMRLACRRTRHVKIT